MRHANRDGKDLVCRLPNAISLLRVLLACFFFALLPGLFLENSGFTVTLFVFGAICVTDLVDGMLARKLGATSLSGAWLDLSADLFYIVISLIVLNVLGQVPIWFTVLVTIKFVEYLITSRIFHKQGKAILFGDPVGRYTASFYFFLPGIICILYRVPGWDHRAVVDLLVLIAGFFTILSSVIRCSACFRFSRVRRTSLN